MNHRIGVAGMALALVIGCDAQPLGVHPRDAGSGGDGGSGGGGAGARGGGGAAGGRTFISVDGGAPGGDGGDGGHIDGGPCCADAPFPIDRGADAGRCCPITVGPYGPIGGSGNLGGYSATGACFVTYDFWCSTNWRTEIDEHGCPVERYDIRQPRPGETPTCTPAFDAGDAGEGLNPG